ncbi:MAG: hypothetical protein AB7I30_21255, partial [Isosphaeraceae bacterium]
MTSRTDPARDLPNSPDYPKSPRDVGAADLSESRARYAARRSEAQARGREDLVSAYQRLGLLTEVWECLRDSSPVAATEVAR